MQDVVKDDTVQFKHLLSQMENLNMLSAAKDKNKVQKQRKKSQKQPGQTYSVTYNKLNTTM